MFVDGMAQDATLAATGSLTVPPPTGNQEYMLQLLPTSITGSPFLTALKFTISGARQVQILLAQPGTGRATIDTVNVSTL